MSAINAKTQSPVPNNGSANSHTLKALMMLRLDIKGEIARVLAFQSTFLETAVLKML
jgi:hypothetical protein